MQASLERLRARREELEGEGGFTLIELLIVIVILGILAAIVVFAVQNLTQQSSNASCQSDWKTVEVAAEAYKGQINSYPANVSALLTTTTAPTSSQQVGPWLKDTPGSSKYQVVVGTANLPSGTGTAGAAATAVYGTLSATDGVIWIGTPGSPATAATQWTAGTGAKVVLSGSTWTASGSITGTATATTACAAV